MFKTIEEYIADGFKEETAEILARIDAEVEAEIMSARRIAADCNLYLAQANDVRSKAYVPTSFPRATSLACLQEFAA